MAWWGFFSYLIDRKLRQQMTNYNSTLPIKSWAEDDRPREKLLSKGRSAMSDAELVAILIGSGSRRNSALDLAKEILSSIDNNLSQLGRLGVQELTRFDGIGSVKALSVVAALELGKRRTQSSAPERVQIKSSTEVFSLMQPILGDLPHEEF